MRNGCAAHKNQKRRGVLIVLCAVVISSVAERSFLHCGQYHIGTVRKRRLGATHILCLSVCKEDFSLTLEMTIRESDVSSSLSLLVTSHSRKKRSCEEMNPHFSQPHFTLPSFGSGFKVQGSGFRVLVAASPPFFRRWHSRIVSLPLEGKVPRRGG